MSKNAVRLDIGVTYLLNMSGIGAIGYSVGATSEEYTFTAHRLDANAVAGYGTSRRNGVVICTNHYLGAHNCIELNRKERGISMIKRAAEMSKEAESLKSRGEALSMFETDEDEVAHMLVTIMSSKKSKKSQVSEIAKMLKDRVKTDLI